MRKGLRCLLEDRATILSHHVLRQITDGTILWHRHRSTGSTLHPCKNFKQSTLAGTILPHKSNAVLGINNKRNVFKESRSSKFNSQSIN